MSGLISRLKRITVSRLEEFLKTVEAPEVLLPKLIREMQSRIEDAMNAESKALSALKADQRRLDESIGRSIRLEKGAEMALRHGDEALAREALGEQIRIERTIGDQRGALLQSEAAMLRAREGRVHLQSQLAELNRRKRDILAKARLVRDAAQISRRTDKIRASAADVLDAVSRMKPAEGESEVSEWTCEELPGMEDRSLEGRLRALEREAEIKRRLDSIMRNRKQSTSKPDA
jgi:phage shock protein A